MTIRQYSERDANSYLNDEKSNISAADRALGNGVLDGDGEQRRTEAEAFLKAISPTAYAIPDLRNFIIQDLVDNHAGNNVVQLVSAFKDMFINNLPDYKDNNENGIFNEGDEFV